MLYFLCLIIASFLSAVSSDECQCKGKCPLKNPNNDVWLLPHENCSMFCSCDHGQPIELHCPPNLHYSPKLRVCTYPQQAQCTSRKHNLIISLNTKDSTSESDNECIGICPVNDIIRAAVLLEHEDCSKYCKCVKGIPQVRKCPDGLHFSPVLGVCTYPSQAQCSRQTVPEETTEDCCPCFDIPTQPKTTTESVTSPSSETSSVAPITSTTLIISTTPRPTTVSTTELITTPSVTIPASTTPDPFKLCPVDGSKNGEFYPHESACEKYYICYNATLQVHQCPKGLLYNPKVYACDKPEKVNCTVTTTPTPPTTPAPAQCPNDTSITLIPHETNCSLYYECKNGIKKLKKCPPGLHFNPFLHICEFPDTAGCTTST